MNESELRQRLEKVRKLIAELTANLQSAEGIRDEILRQLSDLEGAHDRHPVAVR